MQRVLNVPLIVGVGWWSRRAATGHATRFNVVGEATRGMPNWPGLWAIGLDCRPRASRARSSFFARRALGAWPLSRCLCESLSQDVSVSFCVKLDSACGPSRETLRIYARYVNDVSQTTQHVSLRDLTAIRYRIYDTAMTYRI